MAAATADQDFNIRNGEITTLPLAAATKVFSRTLAAADSAGRVKPGADTAGLRIVGWFEHYQDNSAGSAGDLSVQVRRGIIKLNNSGSAAVDADDVGKLCYVEDDNTVAESNTNKVVAGTVVEVESDGVWVEVGFASRVVPTQVTLASTNGTAGAAADLTALKAEAENIGDDVRAIHAALVTAGIVRA
jgi:hypothetical protein